MPEQSGSETDMWRLDLLEARTVLLPANRYGAHLEVRFRLAWNRQQPTMQIFLKEHFNTIEDTYGVARHFRIGATRPERGFFNDSYALISPDALPSDFRYVAEQIYYANGLPAGKTKVIFTNHSVLVFPWLEDPPLVLPHWGPGVGARGR